MNSKTVTKALKRDVFPILRDAGFQTFKERAAWRDGENNTIAVVSFASMGSYLADRIGVTSHSFGGHVGIYYKALHAAPWADKPAPAHPAEHECQARRALRKSMFQFWCWRPDVWYVNKSGSNLDRVMADVRRTVRDQALPWVNEFCDIDRALLAFETREESEMRRGIALEMLGGGLDSYARAEISSALALARGDRQRAQAAWERMLRNPYYAHIDDLRRAAEHRINAI